jgi:HD-like signal output (HDOD) protein
MSQSSDNPEIIPYIVSHLDDFPAFAGIIESVEKITSSGGLAVDDLTDVIIKDIALTSRVLRVVNSVVYRQYDEITTISRAIMVLGLNNIRNIAIGLTFFHNLGGKGKTELLPDLLAKSFFSAFLVKNMAAADPDTKSLVEESFISGLFYSFGDILITFYYPALARKVLEEALAKDVDKDRAASVILGKSYADIGRAIARKWHFPEILIANMQAFRPDASRATLAVPERLRAMITLSNKIGDILISNAGADEKRDRIESLSKSFAGAINNPYLPIQDLIAKSLGETISQSDIFNLDLSGSSLVAHVGPPEVEKEVRAEIPKTEIQVETASVITSFDSISEAPEEDPDAMFSRGIQDISNALFDNFSLNNIMGIALETVYRAFYRLGGHNTIFFIKDKDLPLMKYRFGFGKDLSNMRQWFEIGLGDHKDIFSTISSEKRDCLIRDINAKDIKAMLPPLYAQHINDHRYVILLPVMPANKPLGLIYIDGDSQKLSSITNNHFNYLRILRDQIILAIRQKK